MGFGGRSTDGLFFFVFGGKMKTIRQPARETVEK